MLMFWYEEFEVTPMSTSPKLQRKKHTSQRENKIRTFLVHSLNCGLKPFRKEICYITAPKGI